MPYRPTDKTRAHKAAQHELLLGSAIAIVTEAGFKGLTITALAEKAGVATGTVYKYFKNKADLCAAVFRQATEIEVEKVRQAAFDDSVNSATQRMINAMTSFIGRAIKGRRIAYALMAEPVHPMVEKERLTYHRTFAEIYQHLIEAGIKQGEFPKQNSKLSADALVGVFAEALIRPLADSRTAPGSKAQQQLIDDILLFSLRAITGTEKPL